jgi:hypothetical protein
VTSWTPFPVSRYASYFQTLKTTLGASVVLYPIVHTQPVSSSGYCADDYGSQGVRYMDLQSQIGTGESMSICPEVQAASFARVAQLTANRGACFKLAHQPISSTEITVSVDGVVIGASGFEYNSAENSVCFTAQTVPANGKTINVSYKYATP